MRIPPFRLTHHGEIFLWIWWVLACVQGAGGIVTKSFLGPCCFSAVRPTVNTHTVSRGNRTTASRKGGESDQGRRVGQQASLPRWPLDRDAMKVRGGLCGPGRRAFPAEAQRLQRPLIGICLGGECGRNQVSDVRGHLSQLEHWRILIDRPENCPFNSTVAQTKQHKGGLNF